MGNIEQLLRWKEEMEREQRLYSLGRDVSYDLVPVSYVEGSSMVIHSQELPPEPLITQGTDSNKESQGTFSLSLSESLSDHPQDHQQPEEPQKLTSPDSPSTCFHCGSKVIPGVPCGYCNRTSCYCCSSKDFWRSKAGRVICRVCHPPAPGAEEVGQWKNEKIAA